MSPRLWHDFLPEEKYQKLFEVPRFREETEEPSVQRQAYERFRGIEREMQPPAPRETPTQSILDRILSQFKRGQELAGRAAVEPEIPIIEHERPRPREELTREYRQLVNLLQQGKINEEEFVYFWNNALETVFGNVSPIGLGAGKKLKDIRSFGDVLALGIEATTPVAPEELTAPLRRIPVVGRQAERAAAGLTSPLGLGFAAAWPGLTAKMVAGEVVGGAAGRRLGGETGELVGGVTGALAAPIAGPAAARVAVAGARGAARAAPAATRAAVQEFKAKVPSLQRLLAEEAGGIKPKPAEVTKSFYPQAKAEVPYVVGGVPTKKMIARNITQDDLTLLARAIREAELQGDMGLQRIHSNVVKAYINEGKPVGRLSNMNVLDNTLKELHLQGAIEYAQKRVESYWHWFTPERVKPPPAAPVAAAKPTLRLTNDIRTPAMIQKRLNELAPKITAGKLTPKDQRELGRLYAERDLNDIIKTGTPDDQMQNIADDLLEMEQELELRAVRQEYTPTRAPKFGTPEREVWEAERAGRVVGGRPKTSYSAEPVEHLRERAKVFREFQDNMRVEPTTEEPTVGRMRFTEKGEVVEEPTFATERELAGIREEQGRLPMGEGERPVETAGPMFERAAPEGIPGIEMREGLPIITSGARAGQVSELARMRPEPRPTVEPSRPITRPTPAAPKPAVREAVEPPRLGAEEAALTERYRAGIEPTIPNEPPTPPRLTAIADQPPSMDLWRRLERAHITGTEAQDALRWLAEKASQRGRPIAGLIRTTASPASIARLDPARRAGVVYRLMEEVQDASRMQRMAGFRGRFPFNEGGKPGQVVIEGKPIAFADVAENPSRYALSADQRQWIEDGWRWIDEWADNYEKIVGKGIRAKVEREHYWPRFATDDRGKVYIRTRIGVKESPVKQRVFETMEEGVAEGVPYASPAEERRKDREDRPRRHARAA